MTRRAAETPANAHHDLSVWVLTEGHIGMENQARGLAEAMGAVPVVKRLHPRLPWRFLPPRLWPMPLRAPGTEGDALAPPWPDVLITCGKRATAPSLAIRKASRGRTFTVHIQDPPFAASAFDLLVVPAHDRLRGLNVLVTQAAVHRVTRTRLDEAAAALAPTLEAIPHPRVAVLIGGSNRKHKAGEAAFEHLAQQLAELSRGEGVGLLVTPSRRTGAQNEAILRHHLTGLPAEVWDGRGANPYFGYLGLADFVIVSRDSVSMVSEACASGKPVYTARLASNSRRLDTFHKTLESAGISRPFEGVLESWTYQPLDDTANAAAAILARLGARAPATD
ncbi:MAG TPA: mitochondrial fission ELM1 family protein [Alphaproteobacteria bacterium]|nr:mitochondrial fission ELM1 family protein [Alphaproteobacteria bacterium]